MDPNAEVVARSILHTEGAPQLAALPADQRDRINRVRTGANSNNWENGMKLMTESRINTAKQAELLSSFGIQRDENGNKTVENPESPDYQRRERARTAMEDIRVFLEKGYDVRRSELSTARKNEMRRQILQRAMMNRVFRRELMDMTPDQQTDFVERILKNPEFTKKLGELYDENIEKKLETSAIFNTYVAYQDAEAERNEARTEEQNIIDQIDTISARLEVYRPAEGSREGGAKAEDIAKLRTSAAEAQAKIDAAKSTKQRLERSSARLQSQLRYASKEDRGTLQGQIDNLEEQIDAQDVILTDPNNISPGQKLEQLLVEEQSLRQQQQALEKERRDAVIRRIKAETQWREKSGAYDDARRLKELQEMDIVLDFENMYAKAAAEVINNDISRNTEALKKRDEETAGDAKTEQEREFFTNLPRRWVEQRVRNRRGRQETVYQINTVNINRDFFNLMQNGPQAVGENVIMGMENPTTGANYTQDEAREFMNSDAWSEMQDKMIKQLIAHRMDTSGLSQEDIRFISNSQWGENMIDQALQSNEQFRNEVQKAFGADSLNRHTFWERWRREGQNHSWLFYLLLGLVPPLMFTAYRAAKENPVRESIAA